MANNLVSNLYPPIFQQSVMPAFIYTESCRIYFSISNYNSPSDFKAGAPVQVSVRYQKTNQNALNASNYPSGIKLTTYEIDDKRNGDDKYYIKLLSSDIAGGFELNAYYKIQLRFTGKDAGALPSSEGIDGWLSNNLSYFSEWSQVVLIRGISQPVVTLTGLTPGAENMTNFNIPEVPIEGQITFSDPNDNQKIQSYQVFLYKNNRTLLQASDRIYINNYENTNVIRYSLRTELQVLSIYTIKIQVFTSNLYSWTNDKMYAAKFKIASNSDILLDAGLQCTADLNTGSPKIVLTNNYYSKRDTYNRHSIVKGIKFVIKRASHQTDFSKWEEVDSLIIKEDKLYNFTWYDYSAEPGVWYRYHIIRYNSSGVRTSSIKTQEPIMTDPEDVFLVGEGRQLAIRFNPQISNFSIKVAEGVTETIGAQYPFIRRNGNVYYKTFSLSGSITGFIDLRANTFKASKDDLYKNYKQLYVDYNKEHNIDAYHDYIYEKQFRDEVIKFLYNNTVKLYKSATEGNILIKATNITLTPNTSLTRLIYDFTCSLYEVAEYSLENCKKYKVISQGDYVGCEEMID